MRLVVAITGATGAIYGITALQALQAQGVEVHLIVTRWGQVTIETETGYTPEEVRAMATRSYAPDDQGAAIASGSFRTDGMLVAPCSMKTLAGIAHGYADNLVVRAADVMLKEHRKLLLLVRETPLNPIHLENMLKLSRMGAVIAPPVPAFYGRPQTVDDIVRHTVGRALDQFGVAVDTFPRWGGTTV